MQEFVFVNLVAPGFDPFYSQLSAYLREQGIPISFAGEESMAERQALFDQGAALVAAICGLAYVRRFHEPAAALQLAAAPVAIGERYHGRPVYYTDVVVSSDSGIREFTDLRGTVLAYDRVDSHSGYNVVRYHLAKMGEKEAFFQRTVGTGSPKKALELVLEGKAQAVPMDSRLLEEELRRNVDLAHHVRVIESWGPSPSPPIVMSRSISLATKAALQKTLLAMGTDPAGQRLLEGFGFKGFAPVDDFHYNPIRLMDEIAFGIEI